MIAFARFKRTNRRKTAPDEWTQVIRPQERLFNLKLRELWRFRDLIMLLVRRDFVTKYKQTILGPLWHIIQPLFTAGIFTIVFGRIAALPTDGVPPFLFYMSGMQLWTYFSTSLTSTSSTFIANANLFGKVYFPRLAVPVAILVSGLFAFATQFVLLLGFIGYFIINGADIKPNFWAAGFPILLLITAGQGMGLGILISSMTTRYRDLQQLVSFGVQLLMYATPIIYPLSSVPAKYQKIIALNPMAPIIEAFRYGFLGAGSIDIFYLGYSAIFTVFVLALGIILFNRVERTFMDTV